MNRLIGRLLRQHISVAQLTGFFLANLFGMVIILLGIQFYRDVTPMFTGGDSFMKGEYVIVSKKISTLSSFAKKSNTFSATDIEEIKEQTFTKSVGGFTPTLFNVSAGISMPEAGVQLSTAMFFESVPDEFVDIDLSKWQFDPNSGTIPIIIPRNYLNLYNFGFAQSRNLPKISEGIMGLIQMDIRLRGSGGQREGFKGNIVGFSNRLNTILVPQSFMDWANSKFASGIKAEPARLIIEVNNPADSTIAQFFYDKGYETEDNKLDAGKTTYFLRLIVGIVLGIGIIITILSFYMLMLSIFLLLQKNTTKLESLLLIGYSPKQVSFPYQALTSVLSVLVLVIAIFLVVLARGYYLELLSSLSGAESSGIWFTILIGMVVSLMVAAINIWVIRRKVNAIWRVKE
ncbi:ABC transporter permease [Bacteroides sp. 519]|uniref:ABC transporter permease n=1 Tax=Bacteroides sp. 519 TaxID=2302937 RepID=UPI0013D13844|nr:ABC transporter permease [Bacteroides sp. 519]NDV57919.1 ABC transporter permease [Bacteroides sp. 519]